MMPANFMSSLNEALSKRKDDGPTSSSSQDENVNPNIEENEEDTTKPRILVTNGDGIDSPGLTYLVDALVKEDLYNVFVCAPQLDKSLAGHGITFGETIAVSSVVMNGATAFEVTGTTVDCVSLALSGALFTWSKPALVVSGINKGSCCGHNMLHSGVVAGAREALIGGVPSISISLNWKKGESQESDLNDAVGVSISIINAAIRDLENGSPRKFALSIQFPISPSTNKGFKVTKQSSWRPTLCWQATHLKKQPYIANQPGYGFQLAQLSRDASAVGAVRQKNSLEIEPTGAIGKSTNAKKHFRLEFVDKEFDGLDEDSELKALESNFIAVTPISISPYIEPEVEESAAEWITSMTKEQ